jgi:hypothetical protein
LVFLFYLFLIPNIIVVLMVSLLAIGPKVRDGFLRALKIHSTTSFRKEVMVLAPCKLLWHDKEPYKV